MALERSTRWLAIALGAGFIALVLTLSILRLAYPYEVEWMEGAMMDHAIRLLDGKPIYTAPSIDFVAWLYPPLYYYAVAAMMKIVGVGFFAGRLVSFVSTLLTALALGWIVRHKTANRLFAFLTIALYFATYHATGFYFDIVRNDAFFTFLIVASAASALMLPRNWGLVSSVVFITLAFLTKQQAIFFLPPIALWFWLRNRKEGMTFFLSTVLLSGLALLGLHLSTNGWSTYYLFHIPSAKQTDFSIIRMFEVFPHYALGAFAASSAATMAFILLRRSERPTFWARNAGLLVMMAFAALAAGAISLGNEGGYRNVMMPFAAFMVPLLPIALGELRSLRPEFSRYLYLAVLFQFVALYFNPLSEKMLIASSHQRRGGDTFMRTLAAIPGEVYIPYHGYITRQAGKASHAQILAAIDVLRVHDTTAARLQSDFDSAYARHRFAAIIFEESDVFRTDSVSHYTYSRRMLAEPNVYLTRVADGATRPEFVFLPQ